MILFWRDTVTPSLSIVVEGVLYTEEWKDIKGYEGLYQVSNFGRIKACAKRKWNGRIQQHIPAHFLKPIVGTQTYLVVWLYSGEKRINKYLHILVAKAFLSNPNNLPFVNHKDLDKSNPHVLNLEWISQPDNIKHAYENGALVPFWKGKTGKDSPLSKKILQLTLNGAVVREWESINDAKRDGFDGTALCNVLKGRKLQYRGFLWKYVSRGT